VIADTAIEGNFTGRGGSGGLGGQGVGEGEMQPAGRGGYGGDGGNAGLTYNPETGNPQYTGYYGGGGIYNAGALQVSRSTIAGNNTGAGGNGGGAGIGGKKSTNQYETGAHAGAGGGGGLGGGLFNYGKGATLTNVTIAGNAVGLAGPAGDDGSFPGTPGRRGKGAGVAVGPRVDPGTGAGVYFRNTLVARNGSLLSGDLDCVQYYPKEQYVDLEDLGNNLSYPDSSCPGTVADPLLGPLQNNGGLTETMLPGAGSGAIGESPSGGGGGGSPGGTTTVTSPPIVTPSPPGTANKVKGPAHCPKAKKRVVRKGKATCVAKHKPKKKK
jgi:hypothetical protein